MLKLIDNFKSWFNHLKSPDQFAFICAVLFWIALGLISLGNKIVHI